MADADVEEFQRKIVLSFFALLLIAGICVFWIWGIVYDIWYPFSHEDIGIYTIYVPLIAFGIFGMLLYKKKSAPKK